MLDRLHLFIPFKQEACRAYFWTQAKRRGKVVDMLMSSVDLASLGVPMQAGSVLTTSGQDCSKSLKNAPE